MKRQIIQIDEEKCDGCGACIPSCHEGALEIIDGKARLKDEVLCDGMGSCLGECPKGALSFIEKEIPEALFSGCPGSQVRNFKPLNPLKNEVSAINESQLSHWPIQLKLVPPSASFLRGAHLLIAADCTAFSYPEFNQNFLKGRVLLVGCPKLDDVEYYGTKIREILEVNTPASITVLRMEVPCCSGLAGVVKHAIKDSGLVIPYSESIISIKGNLLPSF